MYGILKLFCSYIKALYLFGLVTECINFSLKYLVFPGSSLPEEKEREKPGKEVGENFFRRLPASRIQSSRERESFVDWRGKRPERKLILDFWACFQESALVFPAFAISYPDLPLRQSGIWVRDYYARLVSFACNRSDWPVTQQLPRRTAWWTNGCELRDKRDAKQ